MLDLIDKGILEQLSANCRISYEELSRLYGISANAIKRRVQKLEESGVIDGYEVYITPQMMHVEFVFGLIITDGSQDESEMMNLIGANECAIAAAAYTDGIYALVAEYDSSDRLMHFRTFLKRLESVSEVELYHYIENTGPIGVLSGYEKIKLNKLHLRLVRVLVEDPRMPISDLAKASGLTAKRTRKLIRELMEGGNFRFGPLLELGSAGSIPFILRVGFDETKKNAIEVSKWMKESFPLPSWQNFPCVSEPLVFSLLCVNEMNEIDDIVRSVRQQDFTNSVKVMISTHHGYFPGLRHRKLHELISSI